MTQLTMNYPLHGVITLRFDISRGNVRNAAAIAQAYDQFHISLTRPAFEELSAAGIVFSGWLDLERTHLGNPRGGTCYVKGYSGFNSEVAVLEWFRKQLPDGWSIVEPRTANGIRNLRSSAP